MLVAHLFGEGPALMSFLMGAFAYDYYFVAPLHTVWPIGLDLAGTTSMTAFLLGTSAVGFATLQMRKSNNNVRSLLRQIENELNDRIQAEHALIKSEESYRQLAESSELGRSQMEAVINSMDQGVIVLNSEGQITKINPSAMKMLRISVLNKTNNKIESLVRKYIVSLPDGSTAPSISELQDRIIDGEKIDNLILRIGDRVTGDSWIAAIDTSAVLDSNGKLALIVIIISNITERITNEQKEKEAEQHRLEFHRRTIQAATNGKLMITDDTDIMEIAGNPDSIWQINSASDISTIRHSVMKIGGSYQIDETRLEKFIIAVGEVTTNTLKHARSGYATIHLTPTSMIFMVSDNGPGIDAINLPDVALRDRYSTAGTLGMGYKVMIAFCDRVYLSTSQNGTTVALEIRYKASDIIFDNEMSRMQCLS